MFQRTTPPSWMMACKFSFGDAEPVSRCHCCAVRPRRDLVRSPGQISSLEVKGSDHHLAALAALMLRSRPSSEVSARTWRMMLSTDGSRRSWRTIWVPRKPVAPVRKTFLICGLGMLFLCCPKLVERSFSKSVVASFKILTDIEGTLPVTLSFEDSISVAKL